MLLLSFDIRNVNFTDDYKKAIEQKQIAQQQAEQMQFVLQKERQEAERKKVEADGLKNAAIARAEGDAKALELISEQLAKNPNLVNYRYVEKLTRPDPGHDAAQRRAVHPGHEAAHRHADANPSVDGAARRLDIAGSADETGQGD